MNRSRRLSRATFGLAVAILSVALFAGSALAVTSGVQYKARETLNNGSSVNACGESTVLSGGSMNSWAHSRTPSSTSCATAKTVPGGYLGAMVFGYMNGSYCGSAGPSYSTVYASGFGIGGAFCGNPSGLQNFQSIGYSYWYRGPSYPYNQGYVIYFTQSPIGSY